MNKIVNQIKIEKGMKVSDLVNEMSKSGVMGAGRMAKAADIWVNMRKDKDCRIFMGVAGALIPGGQREILLDILEDGYIDVFVCTGAMLTHDLVEALGYHHIQGSEHESDVELNKKGFDRMFDSYMPNNVYEGLEKFFRDNFDKLQGRMGIKEFLWKIGSLINKRCILKICYEKKIPIFCPALADSGIGLMLWGIIAQGKKLDVLAFEDLKEMLDIAWTSKKCGVIYLGGGVPKNYIQQAMQLSPTKASYGIQITMDRPEPGGSSGAELREGISWGKMNYKAQYVDLICDVTIALPILISYLKDKI